MQPTEPHAAAPARGRARYQYRLSSLLWLVVAVALVMATVVQTVRYQEIDQRRRIAERQVEELTQLPKKIKTGWVS